MERLNKFLAHAGVGSRRHCDELILGGRVSVDGQVVRELGTRIEPEQQVAVDGKPLREERLVYWLVHKPRGYLCTNHDPAGRPRAVDLLTHVPQRVYTVGRLDEDSEGLLLMTNDGDLAHRLMHPRFGIRKKYLVQVAGRPREAELDRLVQGVWLSEGRVSAQKVRKIKTQGESTWLEVVLSEGKNREVRRMLAQLGHKVMRLRRLSLGPVRLDRLRPGKSRPLGIDEIARLKELAARCGTVGGPRKRKQRRASGQHLGRAKGTASPSPRAQEKRPRPASPVKMTSGASRPGNDRRRGRSSSAKRDRPGARR
jgi:23S rRNA pseudouridine2605 synthase